MTSCSKFNLLHLLQEGWVRRYIPIAWPLLSKTPSRAGSSRAQPFSWIHCATLRVQVKHWDLRKCSMMHEETSTRANLMLRQVWTRLVWAMPLAELIDMVRGGAEAGVARAWLRLTSSGFDIDKVFLVVSCLPMKLLCSWELCVSSYSARESGACEGKNICGDMIGPLTFRAKNIKVVACDELK